MPLHGRQALIHVLFRASLEGVIVRGPMIGRQHAYALVKDWLGTARPVRATGRWPSSRGADHTALVRDAGAVKTFLGSASGDAGARLAGAQ